MLSKAGDERMEDSSPSRVGVEVLPKQTLRQGCQFNTHNPRFQHEGPFSAKQLLI